MGKKFKMLQINWNNYVNETQKKWDYNISKRPEAYQILAISIPSGKRPPLYQRPVHQIMSIGQRWKSLLIGNEHITCYPEGPEQKL